MSNGQVKVQSLGGLCVELGFVSPEQVEECVTMQRQMRDWGIVPKKIGEILLEKGFITPDKLQKALLIQSNRSGEIEIPGYHIIDEIGRGAMGIVYRATQLSLNRTVAIKILMPKFAEDKKYIEKFLKEAKAVARLSHPNIVQAIDVGSGGGVYYFVMEYVNGMTLDFYLKRGGPLDENRALLVMRDMAAALQHIGKYGFVHRDIKPGNIMVSSSVPPKLCDLGVAHFPMSKDSSESNSIIGTPNYLSPEQARAEAVDIRSDIYSLGCTFYHLVVGQTPFFGDTPMAVVFKHIREVPELPEKRNSLVSNEVSAIIMKMMSKDKSQRYQTPELLKESIEILIRNRKEAEESRFGRKGMFLRGRSRGNRGTRR